MLKFRTIKLLEQDIDFRHVTRNFERVIRVGCLLRKSSLDELSQLFKCTNWVDVYSCWAKTPCFKPTMNNLKELSMFHAPTQGLTGAYRSSPDQWLSGRDGNKRKDGKAL